uniref:Uncharacterized protein n=1 Tax=Megaselia scalaris TaxID=36166 RepID=T1H2M5_MEGSC
METASDKAVSSADVSFACIAFVSVFLTVAVATSVPLDRSLDFLVLYIDGFADRDRFNAILQLTYAANRCWSEFIFAPLFDLTSKTFED